MNLLDKIAEKARNTTGKKRGPAIILSSIIDYVAGTHSEMTGHKKELGALVAEEGGERDYKLYSRTTERTMLGEGIATTLATQYCPSMPVVYTLVADTAVRSVNIAVSKAKSAKNVKEGTFEKVEMNVTGIIGTARTIAYKLAGKLKRGEADAEDEFDDDEDIFDDDTFQMPAATAVASAEEDDEGPDFGLDEKDDSGNTLF